MRRSLYLFALLTVGLPAVLCAQDAPASSPQPSGPSIVVAQLLDYRIGPGDVLAVLFWRDKDLSSEVVVRPDGLITLPVINEVEAAGLTTEQLRERVAEKAAKFVTQAPIVSVVVRQIHSRSVYITGRVLKPGSYPLSGPLTVVQLIALAGGLGEYANKSRIVIIRTEQDRQVSYKFNYNDVANRRALDQNIALRPGDSVIVP
jgi:polysaccharide export outer membrane protein